MLVLIASDNLNINMIIFSVSQSVPGERGACEGSSPGWYPGRAACAHRALHTEPWLHGISSHYTPASPRQHLNPWEQTKAFKNLYFTCPQQNSGSREADPPKILLKELILALHECTQISCCRNPLPRGSLGLRLQPCSHLTCQTSLSPADFHSS